MDVFFFAANFTLHSEADMGYMVEDLVREQLHSP